MFRTEKNAVPNPGYNGAKNITTKVSIHINDKKKYVMLPYVLVTVFEREHIYVFMFNIKKFAIRIAISSGK